ncbi:PIN domain-containing protein [Candidatus Thorarchaeota archaeon]|nr:MAG: PIN domain-containing protein [Candidatus Thorarchaeota archaeon]
MPIQVVLDTNFLLVPTQFPIDVFAETEEVLEKRPRFVILDSVVAEINARLNAPRSLMENKQFTVAKALLERCEIVEVEENLRSLPVDLQILEYATLQEAVIATNDRILRKKARSRGIPVLLVRGKKRLTLEGSII